MRIVWLGTYRENNSMRALRRELARIENVLFYGISKPSEDPQVQIVRRGKRRIRTIPSPESPEFIEQFDVGAILEKEEPDILIYDFHLPGPENKEEFYRWIMPEKCSALKVGIVTDAWEKEPRQRLKDWKFDVVFLVQGSKEVIEEYKKEYSCTYYPLPVCFDPEIFKPNDSPKVLNCVFLGAVTKEAYPLRSELLWFLKEDLGIANTLVSTSRYPVEEYAKYLKQSKMIFTCSSVYKYLLAKYFEAMACKCLVVADKPREIPGTKLVDEWNFLEVNMDNFATKIRHYLANPEKTTPIVENAYQYVMSNHTAKIRARQLSEILHDELKKRRKI